MRSFASTLVKFFEIVLHSNDDFAQPKKEPILIFLNLRPSNVDPVYFDKNSSTGTETTWNMRLTEVVKCTRDR